MTPRDARTGITYRIDNWKDLELWLTATVQTLPVVLAKLPHAA